MANYQNHVIDPTFFFDVIEEFSFDYDIYIFEKSDEVDEYGRKKICYDKKVIRGSLQTQGVKERQSKEGVTQVKEYNFYCKSLYRIDIGDIIDYKGDYLRCNHVHEYDEYGCREASLEMIRLTQYRDFADYLQYLKGEKLI